MLFKKNYTIKKFKKIQECRNTILIINLFSKFDQIFILYEKTEEAFYIIILMVQQNYFQISS